MVRNKLAAAILSAGLVFPGLASALGVGEYTLKSYLNQPLELEIDLIQTRDLTVEEVVAVLAPQEDFERVGIEREYFLTNIRFEVALRPNGRMYVIARSTKPVNEPFLNFLVQVQWPQGRMLREYTILLDPPIFKAGAAPTATEEPIVVTAAAPTSVMPAQAPEPVVQSPVYVAAPEVSETVAALPPPPSEKGSVYPGQNATPASKAASAENRSVTDADVEGDYRVQANDTMLVIAARSRVGAASVQQTMMAIQRANPEAFIDGNINLVKKGAVLRIPVESEVSRISESEAQAEFVSQTRAWREMLDSRVAMMPAESAQLQAGKPTTSKVVTAKGTGAGEVTLMAPTASAAGGKASGGKDADKLKNQLAIAEEGLDRAARENKELASRLADLDKQIKSSGQLLGMKNDQISGLQLELNRLREEKGLPPVVAPPSATVVVDTGDAADQNKPQVPAAAADVDDKTKGVEKAVDVATNTAWSANPWVLPLAVFVGLLVAGAAFVFVRRKKQAATEQRVGDDAFDEFPDVDSDAQVADDLALLQDLNIDDEQDDHVAAADAPTGEPSDPLGEADMYAAYGRFQQAADILYAALQREPDRNDVRIKLAEVYAEMGDVDAAKEHAGAMLESGSADIRKQAAELLARLGGGVAVADEQLPSLDDLAMEFSGGSQDSAKEELSFDLSDEMDDQAVDTLDFSLEEADISASEKVVPAKINFTESLDDAPENTALDDLDLDALSFGEEESAAVTADDLSLASDLDDALDFSNESMDSFSVEADELSLADIPAAADVEFSLEDEFEAAAEEVVMAAPAPAEEKAAAEILDLDDELADIQADKLEDGDEFDFLADADENATKLDLARAYIDMGEADGARDILNEVLADGSEGQKSEAKNMMSQLG